MTEPEAKPDAAPYPDAEPKDVRPDTAGIQALIDKQERMRKMFARPAGIQNLIDQRERTRKMFGPPAGIQNLIDQRERMRKMFARPAGIQNLIDQQERTRKMFARPAGIQNLIDQQERMRKMFAQTAGIQNLIDQQERTRKMFAPPEWLESFRRMAESFRKWDKDEQRLLDLLAPRGWLISPSSTVADLSELVQVADERGVDAAEAALIADLTPTRCREIIDGLHDRPSFAAWRTPLDQALIAHEQSLYSLSVPVWLIVSEGIMLTELGSDGGFSQVHGKKMERKLRRRSGGGGRSLDALINVLRVIAEHIPRDATLSPGELRRHAIFHGLDPQYGSEKASIQGVLLLEVLHFQIDELDGVSSVEEGG
jgi:hypothetical protein